MTDHLVVIGGGECGIRAASALREEGFDGDITVIGNEKHLPYERPPLSKDHLLEELLTPRIIVGEERLAADNIAFCSGIVVEGIETGTKRLRLDAGRELPYDKLLLATGSSPRRLTALEGERVMYLRTLDDVARIRRFLSPDKSIVIIGGGFIGLEIAASARKRGTQVTLVESLPRLLSRGVPETIAKTLERRHSLEGVDIVFGDRIGGIKHCDDCVIVSLEAKGAITADLVIVGIGILPNTALAESAGLTIDNGVAVDDRLLTSDPSIFAAGDCCSFPLSIYGNRRVRLESWRNAQEQGSLAARNMLGANEAIASVPWFWSDQYDLSIQVAGLSDEGCIEVRRDLADDGQILFHLDETGRLVAASGIGRGNSVAKDIRLAEMLISKRSRPDPALLGNNDIKFKSLLAA